MCFFLKNSINCRKDIHTQGLGANASSSLILTGITDLETGTFEMSKAISDIIGGIEEQRSGDAVQGL